MKSHWKIAVISVLILFLNTVAAMADELWLKNGDHLTGKVVTMEEGKLIFKTFYAGDISVKWGEISRLITDEPIRVVLSDETALKGTTKPAEDGKMKLKMGKIAETASFDLAEVKSINPTPAAKEPAAKLKGHLNVGLSATKGNTETETQHFDGEFVARTEKTVTPSQAN